MRPFLYLFETSFSVFIMANGYFKAVEPIRVAFFEADLRQMKAWHLFQRNSLVRLAGGGLSPSYIL